MQSDKVFNDWTSVLFISKYTTCVQRWAGKLSCSARHKWLLLAPSSRSGSALFSSAAKLTAKAVPVYCLNLAQLSCAAWHPAPGAPKRTVALYHPVPCHVCQCRCQGQPIRVTVPMVTVPGEQQALAPQPQAARRAWLCPPLLLTSALSSQ